MAAMRSPGCPSLEAGAHIETDKSGIVYSLCPRGSSHVTLLTSCDPSLTQLLIRAHQGEA